MIYIKSYGTITNGNYDEIWMIVRSWDSPDPTMRHVPELSPSLELLNTYLALREKGEWNYNTFTSIYLPRFLFEFECNDAIVQPLLSELRYKSDAGKDICLACFCIDETICHRSIVAGFLQDMGVAVKTETGNDYRKLLHFTKSTC